MPDRTWFIVSFPNPLIFRYHLPLRSKCVLDLNFAPIKGSVFLIFFKKSQILCTLLHSFYDPPSSKGEPESWMYPVMPEEY